MKLLVTLPNNPSGNNFFTDDVRKQVESLGEVIWNKSSIPPSVSDMYHLLEDVDICLTGWGTPRFDREMLAHAPRLRFVAHTGGTVAPLVSPEFYGKGLKISSGNEIYAESVAEGVLCYILCAMRKITDYNSRMHGSGWRESGDKSQGLFGKTIGLVGYGATTRYLLGMLKPFHARILLYSNHMPQEQAEKLNVKKSSLEEIFRESDVISIHAAQRPENYHMIGASLLRLIRRGSVLINAARGDIVDEAAICETMEDGGYTVVLDVYEEEPLPDSHPLRRMKQAILIPHMAGPTVDRYPDVTKAMAEEIARFQKGEPLLYSISPDTAKHMTDH